MKMLSNQLWQSWFGSIIIALPVKVCWSSLSTASCRPLEKVLHLDIYTIISWICTPWCTGAACHLLPRGTQRKSCFFRTIYDIPSRCLQEAVQELFQHILLFNIKHDLSPLCPTKDIFWIKQSLQVNKKPKDIKW